MATFYKGEGKDEHELKVTALGVHNMPSGWINAATGVRVEPGYQLCLFDMAQGNMSADAKSYCFTAITEPVINKNLDTIPRFPDWEVKKSRCCKKGSNCCPDRYVKSGESRSGCAMGYRRSHCKPGTWFKNVVSYSLKRDCSHPSMMWTSECKTGNEGLSVNLCKVDSQCERNRIHDCQTMDKLSDDCLAFCSTNHGKCDATMFKYCAQPENKDKDACACINSPATKYNPSCVDARCTSRGYITKSMREQKCPDIVDCSVYYDLKDTGRDITFTDTNIVQRCQSQRNDNTTNIASSVPDSQPAPVKSTDDSGPAPDSESASDPALASDSEPQPQQPQPSATDNDAPDDASESGTNTIIMVIVALVVALLIGLIIYYLLSGSGSGAAVNTTPAYRTT